MARLPFSSTPVVIALSGAALLMLSGCTTSATDAGPSSTPIDEFAWQQELLQEHADELWNRVEREFPDATRPEAEFIEWSTMAVYVCMVQYPEKPEFPTREADPKP
ncbi:hypothetical protein FB472_1852 [Rhodoglobus vestalii]|uniref:Uncharacterized protein n=1 Tax=Rhodoglobus vestalii TaxID=193384 RepID=A0A8H2K7D6_9MICO|nr:hypothetical protein [Rhodoglobus vestalii]TQO20232.1 hypothetical protein FB472_1852 [Rhodoglobus vestalii]